MFLPVIHDEKCVKPAGSTADFLVGISRWPRPITSNLGQSGTERYEA